MKTFPLQAYTRDKISNRHPRLLYTSRRMKAEPRLRTSAIKFFSLNILKNEVDVDCNRRWKEKALETAADKNKSTKQVVPGLSSFSSSLSKSVRVTAQHI